MIMIRKIILGSSLILVFLAGISPALTLKESINLALKNNPAVIASQKKLQSADARLAQATGVLFPTLKIEGKLGRDYTQPSLVQITSQTSAGAITQNLSFGTDAATDSRSITTSLSQPIFVAALFPGISIAQKGFDLAREDLNKISLDTSFNVTQAYFGVLKADRMVKLSEESREMAESHLKQVKAMLSAGVATQADFLRIEVQLANSEVALTRAKNALEIAKDAFNNALGSDLEQNVQLEEEGFNGEILNLPEYKDLLKMSYNYRPDWKQYILTKQIAEENVRIAQTGYLPTVMLSGKTGNQIIEYPAYRSDVNSWSITGIASWTFFDGLQTQNRIREAAANLDAQKANEEQVKNGIALEVRDAYLTLKSAVETIGSAKKAVESAEENHKVSSLRFSSGVGTNLEVLDAQVSLTQARVNYLQSLFDVEIAKAKLNKVIGKVII